MAAKNYSKIEDEVARDVRYLDSRVVLLIQNQMALDAREEVQQHLEEADKCEGLDLDDRGTQ
ncbi:uncharacterized protein MELLADRAFT_91693 [Melampsora larici-populina 98AG31]|uniref:Uncharacterized protein n=1 Tax=Melampsora larici-populina (strain 98AG31 / pathotype 3-4-7) TaxID=747676 RepID=F4RZZ0_MELLP|nr:uncharacterized protein MELLADRAFT_91693 [Melampsora larici-populina 98AG31]EGG02103.1 hypothetical protein MELLADRAFT_91693 [Melampsora larici-populina 98AG31]